MNKLLYALLVSATLVALSGCVSKLQISELRGSVASVSHDVEDQNDLIRSMAHTIQEMQDKIRDQQIKLDELETRLATEERRQRATAKPN